tara:strand:+ start:569 stop:982 length:414 start_codon:yes stop_codon:yes gene_type:complete
MPTDAPFDFWISEELKQHAIAQHPHDEQSPTLRSLDAAQLAEFQAQLEADPTQVKPAGRFSFKYGMGAGGVRLLPGEERVERSYWFEMPGAPGPTRSTPSCTFTSRVCGMTTWETPAMSWPDPSRRSTCVTSADARA